jgi:hypothetical protein
MLGKRGGTDKIAVASAKKSGPMDKFFPQSKKQKLNQEDLEEEKMEL